MKVHLDESSPLTIDCVHEHFRIRARLAFSYETP
jgi:hypothetical protein